MKLNEAGSLVNFLQSNAVNGQPVPVVGMGATLLFYSDRHPGTIVRVYQKNGKTWIDIREDNYKRIDRNGMSESQEYEFSSNEYGAHYTFRQEENGKWTEMVYNSVTRRYRKDITGLRIGERNKYHDFSF